MLIYPFTVKNNIFAPGSLSASNVYSANVVYASGGNSDLWNSTYSTVSSLSANYILAGGNSKGADIIIGTNDNYVLKLETAGTTKMTVTSAGRVGIGNTDPASILEINDSTGSQKDVTFTLRNGNFGWWGMTSSNTNSSGFLRFASGNSGQTPLTLDAATGNVGITNNTPTARLDIADTTLAGSGGLAGSVLNLTQTWSTSGSPTAIKLNVTNTSSNASSKLIDLQVNGVSSLSQSVSGLLRVGGVGFSNSYGIVTEGGISVGSGASFIAGSQLNVYNSGVNICSLNTGGIQTTSTGRISWGNGASISSPKLYLACDDTGILAQRDGSTPQQSRIYGTYTGITDFERLALKYNGSVYQIGTEKGSVGGVAKPLQFYTDSIVRMVLPTTGPITVRDETGTQQRLINNFTCLNNSYADGSPAATPWILDAATNNILHNYSTRLTLSSSGSFAASGVFTHQIDWPLSELTDVNGMVYADGIIIVRCYYFQNAASVRVRFWNNNSSIWSSWATAIDITNDVNWGVWRASVGGNYMTKLQVETTSPPGNATSTQSIEYYPTRSNGGIRYPHRYATQGGDKLLFGGGKSTHAAIVGSGNTLKIRRGDDSADGSITAAAGTFSTTLSVAGVSTFSSIKTTGIDLIRSDGNLIPGALTVDGSTCVSLGNSGNSNGTNIYGNSTQGVGIFVGSTVDLLKPTSIGRLNGTTSNTDLSIYNTTGGQTKVGIKLGNSSTSGGSNIAINFVDYTDAAYSQIRGIYNGAVQTGQIAFLTANGGALAESLRITNTGNVGVGTTTPNEKLTVVGVISSNNVIYAFGGNSNLWNSTYATVSSLSANNILDGGNTKGANILIGTNDAFNLNLETANTTRMTVTSAGNVGIGTSDPSARLSVTGSGTGTGEAFKVLNSSSLAKFTILDNGNVTMGSAGQVLSWGDSNNSITDANLYKAYSGIFEFKDSNLNSSVYIDARNKLLKLDIFAGSSVGTTTVFTGWRGESGTAGGNAIFQGGNSGTAPNYLGGNGGNVFINSGKQTDNSLGKEGTRGYISLNTYTAGTTPTLTERIRITPDGDAGIGTTTPNARLTVAGVISSTNIVYASGGNSDQWNSAYATVNSISANGATTYTTVNTNSANWSGAYTAVAPNSANWNSVYSSYNGASANFVDYLANSSTQGRIEYSTPSTGIQNVDLTHFLTTGSPQFTNLTVTGNLSVLGDFTFLNTNVSVTSALSVVNNGTGPALYIKQSGTEPIAYFDGVEGGVSSTILFADNGFVGLGTATPNNRLTVVGVISSTNIVYASGGNSDLWNSTYTSVNANSANGATTYTTVNANSANWSSVYSTVCATSANYILDGGNTKGANILIGTNDNFNLNLETSGTTKMTVTSSGNIGIGTTTPSSLLNIYGAGPKITLEGTTNSSPGVLFKNSAGTMSLDTNSVRDLTVNDNTAGTSRFVIRSNGNIGIGDYYGPSNYPQNKLSVNGSASIGYATNADTAAPSNGLIVNGNLGIGTTTPNEKLTVAGVISSSNVVYALGGNSNLWNSTYTTVNTNSASWSSVYTTVCAASANNILDGGNTKGANIFIGTNDAFNLNLETANATRMTITSAGNVGIGTTTPQTFFDVNGTTRVGSFFYVDRPSGNSTAILQFTARGAAEAANFGNPIGNGSAELITSGLNGLIIGNQSATPLVFGTTNLERVRILATGEVGIGTTTPGAKLHVVGTNYLTSIVGAALYPALHLYSNGVSIGNIGSGNITSAAAVDLGIQTPSGSKLFLAGGNTTAALTVAAGQVGIGTTSPSAQLDVYSSTTGVARFNGPTSPVVGFSIAGTQFSAIGSAAGCITGGTATDLSLQTSNNLVFATGGTALSNIRMFVATAGNVGIGTTSPAEKLDVVGNVKVSGHFSAVTKSFLIDHPTKADKKLQYGVVESNQHSVLVRGKTAKSIIELPEEWSGLVHEDSVTVQLTPVGTYQKLFVILQDNEKVVVGGVNGLYNYTIYGERKDVNKLQTEI